MIYWETLRMAQRGQKTQESSKSSDLLVNLNLRFRNNKGDGAFLACEERECKVTADESAWVSSGRRRERVIKALKQTMREKSIH